jgi:hypothetical protein
MDRESDLDSDTDTDAWGAGFGGVAGQEGKEASVAADRDGPHGASLTPISNGNSQCEAI